MTELKRGKWWWRSVLYTNWRLLKANDIDDIEKYWYEEGSDWLREEKCSIEIQYSDWSNMTDVMNIEGIDDWQWERLLPCWLYYSTGILLLGCEGEVFEEMMIFYYWMK